MFYLFSNTIVTNVFWDTLATKLGINNMSTNRTFFLKAFTLFENLFSLHDRIVDGSMEGGKENKLCLNPP